MTDTTGPEILAPPCPRCGSEHVGEDLHVDRGPSGAPMLLAWTCACGGRHVVAARLVRRRWPVWGLA